MLIREQLEQWEKEYLSPYATLSVNSKGRRFPEDECDIRPVFQRDRDKILHCKSFRRLKDKTQVFLSPRGDHYRTRLTHTLEVAQNARTIAKALKMNEELVEAIAYGHDLGHTPFGHAGERALAEICPLGFEHSEQSVRTVDILERDGRGLNLTFEVKDGMLHHQMTGTPHTLEGKIVRLSDKIAYIHHDTDDAIRAGILREEDIPKELTDILGHSCSQRLDHFIHDIVIHSMGKDDILMSEEVGIALTKMRAFMFERVYTNPVAKGQESKAEALVKTLYEYFCRHTEKLPETLRGLLLRGEERERVVCDYIASMSDRYATDVYTNIFIPESWIL